MSKEKRTQDFLTVTRILRETILWFHDARKHPDNADRDLYELARECANGAFKNHALTIPEQRRERVAREFMEACQKEFGTLIPKALAEESELDLELVS